MRAKLLFVLPVILSFAVIAAGQNAASETPAASRPPEDVTAEVVRRILIYKFKPASRRRVIHLVRENIERAWLPVISNTEFRLLTDDEVQDRDRDVYFFSAPEFSKGDYAVKFAFGDPDCNYSGEEWKFRPSKNKVKLWLAGKIGGGCLRYHGSGGNFKTAGKLNTYPNELLGYKFFGSGKLKGLKLTVSTREDVKKSFGSDCETACDYNADWKIDFTYFGTVSWEETVDNKKIKYVPKEELIGRISSIRLIPKRRISFSRIKFPRQFGMSYGFAVGDNMDENGKLVSAVGTSYNTYSDRYGLKYDVYKSGYTVGKVEVENRSKGGLMSIEYSIPESIEKTLFVEKQ